MVLSGDRVRTQSCARQRQSIGDFLKLTFLLASQVAATNAYSSLHEVLDAVLVQRLQNGWAIPSLLENINSVKF